MREDNIDDVLGHNRPALGNLTNRPLKRKLSSILSDSGVKSRNARCKSLDGKNGVSRYPTHVRQQTAKFVKENCSGTAISRFCNDQEFDCSSGSTDAEIVQCDLFNDRALPVQDDELKLTDSEVLEVSNLAVSAVPNCPEDNEKDCPPGIIQNHTDIKETVAGIIQDHTDIEETVDHVLRIDERDISFHNIGSSNRDSTELLTLSMPEGFKSPALERCSGLKTENCANSDTYDELLKTCSCSFCLKASYIWSDLHYQDIKGRISALKKSQNNASILAQKCCKEKESYHDPGNSSKSKLEFDLCGQWMSLFRHMEDTFAQEGSQLQTSFVALKDLREECKMNLEMLNGMPMEKH